MADRPLICRGTSARPHRPTRALSVPTANLRISLVTCPRCGIVLKRCKS